MLLNASLHRLLVPVDFSACSEAAVAHALYLAQQNRSEVMVLHVATRREQAGAALTQAEVEALHDRLRAFVARQFEAQPVKVPGSMSGVDEAGVPDFVTCDVMARAEVAPALLSKAASWGCDQIVMGTHGRRGMRRLLLGSVAEDVLAAAACPVLVVRERAADAPISFRRMLVPVDFSPASRAGVALAKAWALRSQAEVTLLFVVEERVVPIYSDTGLPALATVDPDPEFVEWAARALHQVDASISSPQHPNLPPGNCLVAVGRPDREVIRQAKELDVDLIVLGLRPTTDPRPSPFVGHVAERIFRATECPVLAVHGAAGEKG